MITHILQYTFQIQWFASAISIDQTYLIAANINVNILLFHCTWNSEMYNKNT